MIFWQKYGSQILIVAGGLLLLYALSLLLFQRTHPLTGQPAPAFTLPSLEGQPVDLAAEIGHRVIVLDFWAVWCPPCRAALPKLDALAKDFAGQEVSFYTVNLGDSPEEIKEFLASIEVTLPTLIDTSGSTGYLYEAEYIPQTVIIDKDGIVHEVMQGVSFGYDKALRQRIETLLR